MKNQFLLCVKNDGYNASLELRKLYEYVPDKNVEKHNQIRVIDESGEGYVYPREFFLELRIPKSVEEMLSRAA